MTSKERENIINNFKSIRLKQNENRNNTRFTS